MAGGGISAIKGLISGKKKVNRDNLGPKTGPMLSRLINNGDVVVQKNGKLKWKNAATRDSYANKVSINFRKKKA